jgi:hypothetical protein
MQQAFCRRLATANISTRQYIDTEFLNDIDTEFSEFPKRETTAVDKPLFQ